ncbi:riboflavin biosynthesis protein RibD [Deinococcus proteolyticus MRP]|uniref:Riboflavin biosynthesis protein RibD n=1 Tax=Deinococcus proteolyticus (strain ATCC 35074 / DSM 20540 / JCM 6276 / NBRC 101906 / NCIMB 13154 / VKM Ac-1939 / CCM 2703 / MRP) TaxID=693977 RepID=F0RKF6_DEIPM|nr:MULTISPECIES: bifunctional diaminohydroxyphosphoribosylaminopyrimidine deaminase/5-amino-6-(5-phosphoribosylamino)uracil reductase RibD [Deinococcus]ADY26735.1 riboflavin biosynthesis protein RibD [Deinococcus proteolyticus MRP]MCY1702864.1 bifunctional diaminohydroxyphosphoribosylaminopyrimidine deaminase/5-amino-6-(5-phosphoribosylamino)uracil reductase RibD [Deinococcus sp. SL84]
MNDPPGSDEDFMAQALAEAARGLGRTSPNPPVGCVLVQPNGSGGEVVGRGFHPRAGEPHAEVFALREAGERARGATAYVTLEPCSHFGRTPPCADALMAAGVARVVVAAGDPNPQVNGRGLERLRAAGIAVQTGVLEAQAVRQQAGFRARMLLGRPFVIYKYAMTLDGKVAALEEGGGSEANGAVTGPEARARVMGWRNEADAIAVGVDTLLTDDPQLTTRGVVGGRDPRPVIFDRQGRTPPTARALRPGAVVVTAPGAEAPALADAGAVLLPAATLEEALRGLHDLGVSTLLLEGGPTLASAFAESDLIDEVRAFIAPKLLGAGLSPLAGPLRRMNAAGMLDMYALEQLGADILVSASVRRVAAEPTPSPRTGGA